MGELIATRYFGSRDYRWIEQDSDGKYDDAKHEKL
jgi:hypothetical protein